MVGFQAAGTKEQAQLRLNGSILNLPRIVEHP